MFKYFKELKEIRELKKMALQYQVLLLGKVYEFSSVLDSGKDVLELANKLKGVDEKELVNELVKAAKENKQGE